MLKIGFKNKKSTAVWLVEPKLTIGRAQDNDLVIPNAKVSDYQIEILVNLEQLKLVNLEPNQAVMINGAIVTDAHPLNVNDVISVSGIELQILDPKGEIRASGSTSGSTRKTSPRTPQVSGWAIKANHKALQNRVYPVNKTNVIGRSSECDICLAATHLSRKHAELSIVDGVLHIKDLGSANGTFLNGKQITEAKAKRGDELRLDTLRFGVIGPVDDMAKTTVRTVAKKPAPSAASSISGSAEPKPMVAEQSARSTYNAEDDDDEPKHGGGGLAILVALAVVVVLALIFTRG